MMCWSHPNGLTKFILQEHNSTWPNGSQVQASQPNGLKYLSRDNLWVDLNQPNGLKNLPNLWCVGVILMGWPPTRENKTLDRPFKHIYWVQLVWRENWIMTSHPNHAPDESPAFASRNACTLVFGFIFSLSNRNGFLWWVSIVGT